MWLSKHLLCILRWWAIITLLITSAIAQDLDNVTISGRITDEAGAVISGATIIAKSVATRIERTAVTNADGRYQLIQLPPGTYNVRVFFPSFAPEEKTNLATIAAQNVQMDFVLKPATVNAEAIIVNPGDAAQIDTTRTIVGGTITLREIDSLPNNSRSPIDLIFTFGGVSEEPLSTRDLANDRTAARNPPEEAGYFSISGAPAYSNNITIDGLDDNDDRAARERFTPSLDAIEEVQLIRNQFAAEYGRASGGRLNLRTRSGARQFHGRGFYFFRDEALNANTWKNNALGVNRLSLQEHDPGFTLSGPVAIPRLHQGQKQTFFFAAYEYATSLDSTLVNTLVPVEQNPLFALPLPTDLSNQRTENASAPALNAVVAPFVSSVNTPARNHTLTTRIDHQFTNMHTAQVNYQLGRLRNLRQFGGGNRLAEALVGNTRNSDAIAWLDSYVLNANAVAETRFQFSRLTPALVADGGAASPVVLIGLNDPRKLVTGTLVSGTSTSGGTDRRETRFQFQEIGSYIAGNHSLKLGADVQRIKSTFIDLEDVSGTWDFASAGDFLANSPSRFRQNFLTSSTQRNTYTGFFVQDEWRVKPNFIFSYGLRFENESIVHDVNNFGPRAAIAWDPSKTGKTVIRAGAGIFYNRALLRTIDDFTLGTRQKFFDTDNLIDPATGKSMSATQRRAFIAANLRFPQALAANGDLVKEFGVLNTGFSRRLDPALSVPESYQTNAGLERQIGRRLVIEANYTWNRGLHLWREFNVNAPRLPKGFNSFTVYLASRDFSNFLDHPNGVRPLLNTSTAGDLVRFMLTPPDPGNPNSVVRRIEFGVPVSLVNLNAFTSTTPVEVALAALNSLRPDPAGAEIEQLIPAGNSLYHGLTVELRHRFVATKGGAGFSFRAAYTLSFLKDDGIVNTSDALVAGDFHGEFSRSLLDRRHRFAFSGTFDLPGFMAHLRISPVLRLTSGAPFNIGLGGADRNLDDVGNDRPIFNGDLKLLRWRRPGETLAENLLHQFTLPTIGQSGNLRRNAGIGPGQFFFDLNLAREVRLSHRVRLRPTVEIDNVFNRTVFAFGSEFIDFNAFGPTSTAETRQAFVDSFLVPTRTMRPRQMRLGLRLDF